MNVRNVEALMKSPLLWLWLILGVGLVAHFAFGVVPLSFWHLMGGTVIAVAIWRRRFAYR